MMNFVTEKLVDYLWDKRMGRHVLNLDLEGFQRFGPPVKHLDKENPDL